MATNRCPLCGSETQAANATDAEAIRAQIRQLEQRLQEIEGQGGAKRPDLPTGGYGADPSDQRS